MLSDNDETWVQMGHVYLTMELHRHLIKTGNYRLILVHKPVLILISFEFDILPLINHGGMNIE